MDSILVVGDDPAVLRAVALWLRQRGFVSETVTDCATAIEHISRAVPGAMVLDLNLPDGSGVHVLRYTESVGPIVPSVHFAGSGSVWERFEGAKLGCNSVPVTPALPDSIANVRQTLRLRSAGSGPTIDVENEHARFAIETISRIACNPRVRLGQVATLCGLSESRLSHLLTRITGRTFWEHVEATRLESSREKLATTRLSVKEIAAMVGYSPPELSRHFRRRFGQSPTKWRRTEGPNCGVAGRVNKEHRQSTNVSCAAGLPNLT